MFSLIPLIVFFPVAGLLINAAAGKFLGEKWVGVVASGAAGLSFVIAVLQLIGLATNGYAPATIHLADWLVIGSLRVPWEFQVDTLSVTMMLVVTGVGTLIHIYAIGYMHEDVRLNGDPGRYPRFFVYLNLFLAAMLILVTGNSYLMMFVGWEGVGLCSYLLIGFWYEKGAGGIANARAGRKAFVANRVGDWAMLLAMFLIFWNFHSLIFNEVFSKAAALPVETSPGLLTAITLLLLVGATGKSAQIPLYVWLPDAMAGPTPVSALIHAATMVTAGIYMITRSHVLFDLAPVTQTVVAVIGLATALLAATIALKQNDIKKVLAYSTVSQLGYMFLGLGVGAYTGAVFHVMTHAFFKALLFLGAGSVIHAMGGEQDIRKMGGLRSKLPQTSITFLLGCIAIAGIPPFSGFFSKDEILAGAYAKSTIYYGVGVFTALLTAFYMFRLYTMTFLGKFRGTHDQEHHLHESPSAITIPLIVLALLAAVAGFLGIPEAFAPNAHWLEHFLEPVFAGSVNLHPAEHADKGLELGLMGISVAIALIGTFVAVSRFSRKPELGEPTG